MEWRMPTEQASLREAVRLGAKRCLLFCSYHCYWDPSSGAALCTRELLELLAERGWACRVLCGPRLDFEEVGSLAQLLDTHQVDYEQRQARQGTVPLSVFHFRHAGVPIAIYGSP